MIKLDITSTMNKRSRSRWRITIRANHENNIDSCKRLYLEKGYNKSCISTTTRTIKPHQSTRIGLTKHNINIQKEPCILILTSPNPSLPYFLFSTLFTIKLLYILGSLTHPLSLFNIWQSSNLTFPTSRTNQLLPTKPFINEPHRTALTPYDFTTLDP